MHVWIFCQLRHQIRRFMSHLAIVDVVCHIIILQTGKVWNFLNTKQLKKADWSKAIVKPSLLPGTKRLCVCMHVVIPRAGVLQLALPHTNWTCFSKKTESADHTASMDHKRSSWSHHRSPDAKRPSKKIPATLPHTWDSSLHCMRSNTHYCYAYTAVKLYCVFGWSSCSISITSQSLWILTVETHLNTVIAEWWLALIMGKETAVSITMDSIGHPFSETSCSKAQIPHSWMHENWTWNQYKRLGKRVSIFDRRYIHDDFFGVPVHVPIPCYESGDHVSQIPTSSPIWAKAERQLELSEMAF